ncbi:MAG: hypothetical protein ACI35S_02520 [Anaeroplasma sp.]
MLKRVGISLFRPSMIGMFYKDKLWVVLTHAFVFVALFITCFSICSSNEKYFSSDTIENITSLVQNSNDELDIKYENNTLTGTGFNISSTDFKAYFLESNFKKSSNVIILHFKETEVDMFYGSKLIKSYEYSKSTALSFEMNGVKNANIRDVLAFEALVSGALSTIDAQFMTLAIISNILSIIGSYIGILLFGLFFSYIINSSIDFKIRIKLCLYCSLNYFVVWIFAILLNASFLQYVAFLLPLVYINMAFSHIIKIKIKK